MGRTAEFEPLRPEISQPPKSPLPHVEIIAITTVPDGEDIASIVSSPTVLAGESARTCYSNRGIYYPKDYLDPRHKKITNQVIESTRKAGHLTTRQHSEIVFGISNISRQFIWSFLHTHPFYNSEQVSQRYVAVKEGNFFIPPLEGEALRLYLENAQEQMEAYNLLKEILNPVVAEEYFKIFPSRFSKEKWQKADESTIGKKTQEIARYVLGIDTFSYLYHTINALTLMRYFRTCSLSDVPLETKLVIYEMVNQVAQLDPNFLKELNDPYPLEETPEFEFLSSLKPSQLDFSKAKEFIHMFDRSLEGKTSKLVDWSVNGEVTLANAVRDVLGLTSNRLSDEEAIELVLNPAKNRTLGDVLNLTTLHKLSQALHSIAYTFRRKISHTADSQDQRHRMVPAARPIIATHYSGEPDYITPALIEQSPEALTLYQQINEKTFTTINQLLEMGISREFALYRLPNAFPIRFTESGNLLFRHLKYRLRQCFNAQEEIWRNSIEETQQIGEVHPSIGKWLLAPCGLRWAAHTSPFCPEGDRYCGRPVWDKKTDEYPERII